MKYFNLSIGTLVLRFYLMMLIIIVAGFIGQWWLSILALPVFLSCMLGINISKTKPTTDTAKVVKLPNKKGSEKVAI